MRREYGLLPPYASSSPVRHQSDRQTTRSRRPRYWRGTLAGWYQPPTQFVDLRVRRSTRMPRVAAALTNHRRTRKDIQATPRASKWNVTVVTDNGASATVQEILPSAKA